MYDYHSLTNSNNKNTSNSTGSFSYKLNYHKSFNSKLQLLLGNVPIAKENEKRKMCQQTRSYTIINKLKG